MYSGKKRRGVRAKERVRREEENKGRLRTRTHASRSSKKQHFVTLYKLSPSAGFT